MDHKYSQPMYYPRITSGLNLPHCLTEWYYTKMFAINKTAVARLLNDWSILSNQDVLNNKKPFTTLRTRQKEGDFCKD